MRLPKRSFVFYMEIQIFTVVPKRPFLVLQGNTKFCSCIQTAIHFFYSETQIFENYTQTVIRFFTTKYRILKVVLKRPFVFPIRRYEI